MLRRPPCFLALVFLCLAAHPNAQATGVVEGTCVPPPPGVVGWWSGDLTTVGMPGGTGTLQGGATYTSTSGGKVANAFTFDGVDDYVSIPNTPSSWNFGTGDFTVHFWERSSDTSRRKHAVSLGPPDGPRNLQFDFDDRGLPSPMPDGSHPGIWVYWNSGGIHSMAAGPLGAYTNGAWHHIALTRRQSRMTLYVDAVAVASTIYSAPMDLSNLTAYIGAANNGNLVLPWSGEVDELAVHDRALSAAELWAIVLSGSGGMCKETPPPPQCLAPPSGLLGWWPGDGTAEGIVGGNATPYGAGFGLGKVDRAFTFDGVDDYVSLPGRPEWNFGTGDFTVDFWELSFDASHRTHALSFATQDEVLNLEFDFNDRGLPSPMPDGSHPGIWVYWNSGGINRIAAGALGQYTNGAWHHIALTRSGTTMTLYVDAEAVGSTTYAGAMDLSGQQTAYLGAGVHLSTTPRFFWNGKLDELAIRNRALSAAEIGAIVYAGREGMCKGTAPPPPPPCVTPPSGLLGWWPGDGTADAVVGENATLEAGAGFADGQVAQAFTLDGVDDYVSLEGQHPEWNFGTGEFTVHFWERSSDVTHRTHALSFVSADEVRNLEFDFNDRGLPSPMPDGSHPGIWVYWNSGGINSIAAGYHGQYTDGAWHHIALTRRQSTMTLYVDGDAVGSATYAGAFDLSDPQAAYLGAGAFGTTPRFFWNGELDELAIHDRALSVAEIEGIVLAGPAGMCKGPGPPAVGDLVGSAELTCNGESQPAAGVTVTLYPEAGSLMTTTDAAGEYRFDDIPYGTYVVSVGSVDGYAPIPATMVVTIDQPEETAAPFTFFCQLADIQGTVTGTCNATTSGLQGVTIALYRDVGAGLELVGTTVTDAAGGYAFADVPLGTYVVDIVLPPLGYSSQIWEQTIVLTAPDQSFIVPPFPLACQAITANPRGIGYWRHQVNVHLTHKGNADIPLAQLISYIDDLEVHFNGNLLNPVVIYTPLASGSNDKLLRLQQLLTVNRGATQLDRSKGHLLALMLNVVAGKISQTDVISGNGATVSQAITYSHDLIVDTDPANDSVPETICILINGGTPVPDGMVPASTRVITYQGGPASEEALERRVAIRSIAPNPFTLDAVISFELVGDTQAVVEIHDLAGRRIAHQAVGGRGAGLHTVRFSEFPRLAPGVYLVRLTQGRESMTRRVAVVR